MATMHRFPGMEPEPTGQFERVVNRRDLALPEDLFERRPDLASKDAQAVTYVCAACGQVEPHRMANGFLRRACACERRQQEFEEARKLSEDIQASITGIRASKTYTWLGPLACEPGLEDKTFIGFDATKQRAAYQMCLAYEADFGTHTSPNLLLASEGPGTGKTHLACAIANALRRRGVLVLFASVVKLFDALFAANGDEKARLFSLAGECSLLVLDDLTALYIKPHEDPEKMGLFQKSMLYDIINSRYNRRLPTIITANTSGNLDRWLDAKTQDRLYELCDSAAFINMSYRRILALKRQQGQGGAK